MRRFWHRYDEKGRENGFPLYIRDRRRRLFWLIPFSSLTSGVFLLLMAGARLWGWPDWAWGVFWVSMGGSAFGLYAVIYAPDRRARAAFDKTGGRACPGCLFDLRGAELPDACPECGRSWDEYELDAEWAGYRSGRRGRVAVRTGS